MTVSKQKQETRRPTNYTHQFILKQQSSLLLPEPFILLHQIPERTSSASEGLGARSGDAKDWVEKSLEGLLSGGAFERADSGGRADGDGEDAAFTLAEGDWVSERL